MMRTSTFRWILVVAVALLVGAVLLPTLQAGTVLAQGDDPLATATTTPPATNTPTLVPTNTPTLVPTNYADALPTATEFPATPTLVPGPRPTPKPVPIPEPVTVVLFGTGLAALSAAVATSRKKKG